MWYFKFNNIINKYDKCSGKKVYYNYKIISQKVNKKMIKWDENKEIKFKK